MFTLTCRARLMLVAISFGCSLVLSTVSLMATVAEVQAQLPTDASAQEQYLTNPNFECATGVYTVTDITSQELIIPAGWTWVPISGTPMLISTRIRVTGNCDPNSSGFVDRIEGEDSFMFRSADIETPPVPGKPFDVAIAQRISVTPGTDYSISGFMASFCGGSASPTDCPDGYYISKQVGLDPDATLDPLASTAAWAENRQPHTTAGYANVSVAARAAGESMTAYVRIHSPFQWHGNHAIIDDFRMVEAPTIDFVGLPNQGPTTGTMGIPIYTVEGRRVEISWAGELSNEIQNLAGEGYELKADVQFRRSGEREWQDMVVDHVGDGCQAYVAPSLNTVTHFRVGALAARPNTGGHRFRSRWSDPVAIQFVPESSNVTQQGAISPSNIITSPAIALYLPIIDLPVSLECSQLNR